MHLGLDLERLIVLAAFVRLAEEPNLYFATTCELSRKRGAQLLHLRAQRDHLSVTCRQAYPDQHNGAWLHRSIEKIVRKGDCVELAECNTLLEQVG